MKNLIGALSLAAMVATSAFAEVSFGAWICNLPTLVASDGDTMKSGITNPWGWGSQRPVRLQGNWTSDDGKAGMTMGMSIEYGNVVDFDDDGNPKTTGKKGWSIGTFTPNTFWIKPIDQVKVIVGQMDNSFGVRGDMCYGSWDWLRPNNWLYDGEGFSFSTFDETGFGLEITPMEALKIFAAIPLEAKATDTYKAFGNANVGAAYTIDGIGTIKAGILGEYTADGDAKKNGTIEAAFDLTGIDKLYATLGVAFQLASSDWWDANESKRMLKLALGASYGITEAFKLSASFELSKPKKGDMAMAFGVGANYAITDALGAVADFRLSMPNNDKDSTMSFLVGLNYACGSNASLGVGFQAAKALGDKTGTAAGALGGNFISAYKTDALVWAVPIRASFWF